LDLSLVGIVAVIVLALAFDYTNGFHDAANSIATVVSTRVLSPRWAVMWTAFFNFIAFLVFGTHVGNTIAKDVVVQDVRSVGVVFSGLVGAIGWNLFTFYAGLPTSSSHALVGGIAGGAVARFGPDVLISSGLRKIGVFIVLSPLIGLALAMVFMIVVLWTFHRVNQVDRLNRLFRRGQLLSAADVPLWVVLAAHTAIALGTLSGGWRIVKTLGSRITRLQPVGGMAAETAAAVTLFAASASGIPVSTTHTISGAIVGVGTVHRMSAVRWSVAARVLWAWILTIPGAFLVAAVCSLLVQAVT
jgi:PiT family inorganic phosphate transporter